MRNLKGVEATMERVYLSGDLLNKQIPDVVVPRLLPTVRPVHTVVRVDVFVPGCPPKPDTIYYLLTELLEGRLPNLRELTRFGA
jgi:NAD-reducing hydrogenase small subunit